MKRLTGTVIRATTPKTAFVKVVSEWMHPKYLKKTRVSTVFACHDEMNTTVGDEVVVIECKPISKTKHFKVETITKKTVVPELKVEKKAVAKKPAAKSKKK